MKLRTALNFWPSCLHHHLWVLGVQAQQFMPKQRLNQVLTQLKHNFSPNPWTFMNYFQVSWRTKVTGLEQFSQPLACAMKVSIVSQYALNWSRSLRKLNIIKIKSQGSETNAERNPLSYSLFLPICPRSQLCLWQLGGSPRGKTMHVQEPHEALE